MRANRPISPHYSSHTNLNQMPQSQTSVKKYYSREEVSQILRATMESKLTKIYK